MIVKNESSVIERALDSVKNVIDYFRNPDDARSRFYAKRPCWPSV